MGATRPEGKVGSNQAEVGRLHPSTPVAETGQPNGLWASLKTRPLRFVRSGIFRPLRGKKEAGSSASALAPQYKDGHHSRLGGVTGSLALTYGPSPFPLLDAFIETVCSSQAEVQGRIRSWTLSGSDVLFNIKGSR